MRALVLSTSLVLLSTSPARAADPVDYARSVKPILAQHCVSCHGPDKQRGGLRLDTAAGILQGGDSGPAVVRDDSAGSRLIQAVTGSKPDDVAVMPPKGPRLTDQQVAAIRGWIDQGARAPADEAVVAASKSKHWAFQPVRRLDPPAVKDANRARNPIDRFVLARLEKEGIAPSPEADKATLIRRLTLDLTGLPPTPAEIDAFLKDESSETYEKLVDRVLRSPHYGERWGRHWLDLARYADSNGYSIDAPRSMWPYRDWVINALNADLPFDRFTVEQLAGDLLPAATTDQKVATGFHRNTPINQEGGINLEQFRIDSVVDRTNTTGSVWLGLTVGCCQCHDHKFDPISHREYYRLFAFLNNDDEPVLDLLPPEQQKLVKQVSEALEATEKQLKAIDPVTPAGLVAWEKAVKAVNFAGVPDEIRDILEVAENGRDEKQIERIAAHFRQTEKARHVAAGLASPLSAATHGHLMTTRTRLEAERAELKQKLPPPKTTLVLQARSTPRETRVLIGGDFTRPGVAVRPSTPAVLPSLPESGKQDRLALARWIVDPANPLTSRVFVNRVWQQYFGLGLVETENDFGTQGTPPSHPELLDWLASEFINLKWSQKALHKLIVTSATYRQSSKARPDLAARDPRNRLLARQSRLRLDAEIVRDVCLAASGLLNPAVGGPSVFPPQPEGIYRFTQIPRVWRASAGPDRYRRGLYTHFWRSAPHPALMSFDAPEGTFACTRRNRSNTPLQALTLLNDEGFAEYAEGLADRLLRDGGAGDDARLRHGFRLCLAREPAARELSRLQDFLAQQRAGRDAGAERAAWAAVARVLLNLDELITRE